MVMRVNLNTYKSQLKNISDERLVSEAEKAEKALQKSKERLFNGELLVSIKGRTRENLAVMNHSKKDIEYIKKCITIIKAEARRRGYRV